MLKNLSIENKLINFVFFITFLAGLLPFLILAFYNHPSADDYLWSVMVLKTSLWQFQVYNFYEWSGRYFSNVLVGLNPLVFHSFLGYQLCALFFIIAFALSVYLVIKNFTKNILTYFEQILGSLAFTVLFLAYTPSVVELFYWFTGAAVYTSANILFFLFVYCLLRLHSKSAENLTSNRLIPLKLSIVALVILMMWSNEIIIVGLAAILFLLACFTTYYKHSTYQFFIFLLVVGAVAAVVSILAPGNAARAAAMFPNKFNLDFTVRTTLIKFIGTLYWFKNVPLWLISFLLIPFFFKLSQKTDLLKNHFYIHPILSIGAWLAILCFAYFPIHLATGQEGIAMRVRATNYLFFLVGWFFNLQLSISFLEKRFQLSEKYKILVKRFPSYLILSLLLFFSYKFFSTNSNVGEAWNDLSNEKAPLYDKLMKERYELFSQKNTTIPYIWIQPTTLFFADLEEKPQDWKNRNYASYFGLDSIKVVKISPQ